MVLIVMLIINIGTIIQHTMMSHNNMMASQQEIHMLHQRQQEAVTDLNDRYHLLLYFMECTLTKSWNQTSPSDDGTIPDSCEECMQSIAACEQSQSCIENVTDSIIKQYRNNINASNYRELQYNGSYIIDSNNMHFVAMFSVFRPKYANMPTMAGVQPYNQYNIIHVMHLEYLCRLYDLRSAVVFNNFLPYEERCLHDIIQETVLLLQHDLHHLMGFGSSYPLELFEHCSYKDQQMEFLQQFFSREIIDSTNNNTHKNFSHVTLVESSLTNSINTVLTCDNYLYSHIVDQNSQDLYGYFRLLTIRIIFTILALTLIPVIVLSFKQIINWLDNYVCRIRSYTHILEVTSGRLRKEMRLTDNLLYQMLPKVCEPSRVGNIIFDENVLYGEF